MAHRGKIVQSPRLATASHLWLKTERAVPKRQLLKAGVVLKTDTHKPSARQCVSASSYVSNIKRKSFFLFKNAMKLMSGLKSVIDDWCNHLITPTIILIIGHSSNSAKFRGNVKNFAANDKFRDSARSSTAHRKLWALHTTAMYFRYNKNYFLLSTSQLTHIQMCVINDNKVFIPGADSTWAAFPPFRSATNNTYFHIVMKWTKNHHNKPYMYTPRSVSWTESKLKTIINKYENKQIVKHLTIHVVFSAQASAADPATQIFNLPS